MTQEKQFCPDGNVSKGSEQILRQRAEDLLRKKAARIPEDLEALSPEETRQTLHELRVHQIELEMQNEELRRTQGELEAARARYYELYDLAPVGYCTLSEKGLILEANLTAATLLGTARSALVNRPWTRFILPADQDTFYRHHKRLFETPSANPGQADERQVCELRMVKKDGTAFWGRLEASATQDADCAPMCRVVVTDISERKRAEEEIRTLNAGLERRVAERTVQLEASNKELEAFAYSVAHDLRAPLRAVDGYTRILVEEFGAHLDDEGRRVCSVISESAQNMGRLIDDLLAFSQIGRVQMQLSSIDTATLVNKTFFELTTPTERERIDFHVASLPPAQGDPGLIRQVWMKLLSNAVKFSAQKERAVIEVSAAPQGDEMVYSVRDNGAGFDMAYADKLFGVFQRLHGLREFEGTGVGLAIVRRIVQRHGGRVWADGETGQGATFYFTLENLVS